MPRTIQESTAIREACLRILNDEDFGDGKLSEQTQDDVYIVVLAMRELIRDDDEMPIDEAWLEQVGFRLGGLEASLLIPPANPEAAIAEMIVHGDERGLYVSLIQGVPDDPNVSDDHVSLTSLPDALTRGHMRRLCADLGAPLKETP